MNDGRHYSALKEGAIKKFDITTGGLSETIFDGQKFKSQAGFWGEVEGYTFSDDESKILIESEGEAIYRHSSNVNCYVYDVKSTTLTEVYTHGKSRKSCFFTRCDDGWFCIQ